MKLPLWCPVPRSQRTLNKFHFGIPSPRGMMMMTMMMQEVWMQEVGAGDGCRRWMQEVDAGGGCRRFRKIFEGLRPPVAPPPKRLVGESAGRLVG